MMVAVKFQIFLLKAWLKRSLSWVSFHFSHHLFCFCFFFSLTDPFVLLLVLLLLLLLFCSYFMEIFLWQNLAGIIVKVPFCLFPLSVIFSFLSYHYIKSGFFIDFFSFHLFALLLEIETCWS